MKYEWDENKRAANLAKHGVDFIDAEHFDWLLAIEGPLKLLTIALIMAKNGGLLLVLSVTVSMFSHMLFAVRISA
jgi:uncharacterized DUF497 family protein